MIKKKIMAVKIKPADTAFSKCVREAYDYTCVKCHAKHERGSLGLHCSHVFSRRHRTIRWCKENAKTLCFSCHQWFGGSPVESGVWVRQYLGDDVVDILIEKKESRVKVTKKDEKLIAAWYRDQTLKIKAKRDNGETGFIDFDSWQ